MSSIAAVGGAHAAVAALTGGAARPDWWDESDAAAITDLLRAFECVVVAVGGGKGGGGGPGPRAHAHSHAPSSLVPRPAALLPPDPAAAVVAAAAAAAVPREPDHQA